MTKQEKLSKINNNLVVAIAEENAKKAEMEASYYANIHKLQKGAQEMREAVLNEPDEVDEPQTETSKDSRDVPSIFFDGTQTSLIRTIVAVFNDSPAVPADCSFDVSVFHHSHKSLGLDDETVVHLVAYNSKKQEGGRTLALDISECDSPEEQMKKYTEWRAALDYHFAQGKEADNE